MSRTRGPSSSGRTPLLRSFFKVEIILKVLSWVRSEVLRFTIPFLQPLSCASLGKGIYLVGILFLRMSLYQEKNAGDRVSAIWRLTIQTTKGSSSNLCYTQVHFLIIIGNLAGSQPKLKYYKPVNCFIMVPMSFFAGLHQTRFKS